jgi:hypothetical protein
MNCLTCFYFEAFEFQKRDNNTIGACHYGPPLPMVSSEGTPTIAVFPILLAQNRSAWCGCWEKKS